MFQGHTLAPSSLCLPQELWLAVHLDGLPSFTCLVSKDFQVISALILVSKYFQVNFASIYSILGEKKQLCLDISLVI